MDDTNTPAMSAPLPLQNAITALEHNEAIDAVMGPLEQVAAPVSSGAAASFLQGDWLGHALHPLMTDFPLGCWMSATVLDLVGGRGAQKSAQRLIGLGLLAVPTTAASGLSDWSTLRDPRTRRVGAVHAIGNTAVAFLYFRSWRSRRRGHHLRGVGYSLLGGAGAMVTGYLGGHLSFARQAGTGERGLGTAQSPRAPQAPRETSELVDLPRAAEMLSVPVTQVRAMVEDGLLDPVQREPYLGFRESDVLAVRMLGA